MLSFKQYILEVIIPAKSRRMTSKAYLQAGLLPQQKYVKVNDEIKKINIPNAVDYKALLNKS